MKRIVLGTAGHIDHGKTLLTKALTGVDTDRLAEEKARGITIELGFAPLRLPDGSEISLVDVPGHEKFVRTMMSGVAGVDGILLVIAADDGVMPQTQEHFDILRLLGVRHGIVVLTKTDLVGADRLSAVRQQVMELTAGSFLENAPICPVSAVTGEGLDSLRAQIVRLVQSCEERSSERPFRLSIDRAFPVEGFGTVVSGTVTEGSVRVGERIALYPSGQVCTVRSLQTHGRAEPEALAGMRAAMSFSGFPKDLALRGCTVAEPDSLLVTDLLTVRMQILQDCPYPIRNSSQLHLFCGTGEVICKLRLLDADVYKAGQSGYAQLRLSAPIPVRWGDRFLLRFFSPVVTIGGGTVLACGDSRLRRHDPRTLERLARLENPSERLLQRIEDSGLTPLSRTALRHYSSLSPEEYAAEEAPLLRQGSAVELLPGVLVSARVLSETQQQAQSILSDFHAAYPLQPGMGSAEFRSRLFGAAEVPADALLRYLTERAALCMENGYAHLPDFVPVFTQEHKIMQRKLLHYYREAWFFAPDLQEVKTKFARFGLLFEQVLANLRIGGQLIALTPRYWVHFEAYAQALHIFSELAADGKPVTLAELRTAAGISRKYSQLFLEYWDRRGVTRRVGDAHILIQKPDAP